MKTLVVYFSRKGYVKKIAERTAAELGGELFELKTAERTRGVLGFWWCGRFAMHRWPMEILDMPIELESYDKVVICSPVWAFSLCAPVRDFLIKASGKVRAAEYIFVHFSPPSAYNKTAGKADALLGVKRGGYSSAMCMWGKEIYIKRFE